MKIIELLEIDNPDKVVFGPKEVKFELDTETGKVALDAPAMFVDPVLRLEGLKRVVDRMEELRKTLQEGGTGDA